MGHMCMNDLTFNLNDEQYSKIQSKHTLNNLSVSIREKCQHLYKDHKRDKIILSEIGDLMIEYNLIVDGYMNEYGHNETQMLKDTQEQFEKEDMKETDMKETEDMLKRYSLW